MKLLATVGIVGLLLASTAFEASAEYCRAYGMSANGWGRASGWGRSESPERARYLALYQCSVRGWSCRITDCLH